LAGFVAAAERYDDRSAAPGKIKAISRAIVYAKLADAITYRLGIAKVAKCKAIEADSDTRFGSEVPKTIYPRQEYGSLSNLDHL
jgi:hypothetical protein